MKNCETGIGIAPVKRQGEKSGVRIGGKRYDITGYSKIVQQ